MAARQNPPRDGEGDRAASRRGGGGSRSLRRPEVYRARKLRREMSLPEVVLWNAVRRKQLGFSVRKQHPIGPYIADFYCAAERLAIDQSALSRRIRQLEDLLGYQLIRRTTREVSLTAAGEIFHERTRLMRDQIATAVRAAEIAAEGKAGSLRVGYMSFAAMEIMPRIVREFTSRYPDIELELQYLRTQGQKIELSRNNLDVGFMLGPFGHPQFDVRTLVSEPPVAILSADHRLATRHSLTLSEIAAYPMVLGTTAEWDTYRLFVDDMFSSDSDTDVDDAASAEAADAMDFDKIEPQTAAEDTTEAVADETDIDAIMAGGGEDDSGSVEMDASDIDAMFDAPGEATETEADTQAFEGEDALESLDESAIDKLFDAEMAEVNADTDWEQAEEQASEANDADDPLQQLTEAERQALFN